MTQSVFPGLCVLGLIALAAGPAWGQAAPAAAASAPKDARETKEAREAREAAEAMERARRLAANPMRVILEASRVRRRVEAEPAAASAAPLLPVVASAGAAADPAPRVAPPPREAPAAEPASAVISSDLAQARVAADSAPALDAAALPRPLAAPAVALPAVASLLPGIVRPTLVNRVDPELPPRLLVDLPPNTVVTVELSIRADGSVAQVNLVSPGAGVRLLSRFIVAALQQWRFAPLPTDRDWRVDLVLNAD